MDATELMIGGQRIAFSVAANPNSASRTGRLVVTPYRFGIDDEGSGALAPVTITVMQSAS